MMVFEETLQYLLAWETVSMSIGKSSFLDFIIFIEYIIFIAITKNTNCQEKKKGTPELWLWGVSVLGSPN